MKQVIEVTPLTLDMLAPAANEYEPAVTWPAVRALAIDFTVTSVPGIALVDPIALHAVNEAKAPVNPAPAHAQ